MAHDLDARTEPYAGMSVLDDGGAAIGSVSDVIYDYDNGGMDPAWFVVDGGLMRAEHFVPADGSYMTAKGQLVVPFDKKWVRDAPKAPKGHILTSDLRRQLAVHYG